ncbi:MAG TPA: DUF4129 domain-containing protein [Ktedonobacterales bacterium]
MRPPQSWSWARRAPTSLWLTVCQVLVESLAIFSWLALLAAYLTGTATNAAMSLWLIAGVLGGFALIATLTRRQGVAFSTLSLFGFGVLAYLVTIRLSPVAFGGFEGGPLDFGWLSQLRDHSTQGLTPGLASIYLSLLIIFCGWQGMRLSRFATDDALVRRRWFASLLAVLVACAGAVSVPTQAKALLAGELGLTLGATMFFGLVATMLAGLIAQQDETPGADLSLGARRWQAMSVALAGLVVLLTLTLSAIFSFASVTALLRSLGPVGVWLDEALTFLISSVIAILRAIFGDFGPVSHPPLPIPTPPKSTPPSPPAIGGGSGDQWQLTASLIIGGALMVFLIILTTILVRRLMWREGAPEPGVEEDRESLDGGSLLRVQLRDLRNRLLGRLRPHGEPLESLDAQSARAIYRDLLRRAQAAGITRGPTETPDELFHRLAQMVPVAEADLAEVTAAYDTARYGDREPAPRAIGTLREAAHRIAQRLGQGR